MGLYSSMQIKFILFYMYYCLFSRWRSFLIAAMGRACILCPYQFQWGNHETNGDGLLSPGLSVACEGAEGRGCSWWCCSSTSRPLNLCLNPSLYSSWRLCRSGLGDLRGLRSARGWRGWLVRQRWRACSLTTAADSLATSCSRTWGSYLGIWFGHSFHQNNI